MRPDEIRKVVPDTLNIQNSLQFDRDQSIYGMGAVAILLLSEIAAQLAETEQALERLDCPLSDIAKYLAEGHLSLRDRFAMAAMQGLMVNNVDRRQDVVETAYLYADSMIAQRAVIEPITPPAPDVDAEVNDEDIKRQVEHRKAVLASPTSDPERLVWCADCLKEFPRPDHCQIGGNIICDDCMPF